LKKETNKIIGCIRYFNVDEVNQRLEIGYTWYSESYQRTSLNTECKYLPLSHAFEILDAIAVEFRTHWHNHKSRYQSGMARSEAVFIIRTELST